VGGQGFPCRFLIPGRYRRSASPRLIRRSSAMPGLAGWLAPWRGGGCAPSTNLPAPRSTYGRSVAQLGAPGCRTCAGCGLPCHAPWHSSVVARFFDVYLGLVCLLRPPHTAHCWRSRWRRSSRACTFGQFPPGLAGFGSRARPLRLAGLPCWLCGRRGAGVHGPSGWATPDSFSPPYPPRSVSVCRRPWVLAALATLRCSGRKPSPAPAMACCSLGALDAARTVLSLLAVIPFVPGLAPMLIRMWARRVLWNSARKASAVGLL